MEEEEEEKMPLSTYFPLSTGKTCSIFLNWLYFSVSCFIFLLKNWDNGPKEGWKKKPKWKAARTTEKKKEEGEEEEESRR